MIDISKLLTFGVQQGASDCHISAGEPPMIRLHGDLKKLDHPPLSQDETHALIYDMMSDAQRKNFEEHRECDFSFDLGDIARFRVNVFVQGRGLGAVFRTIPTEILPLEKLGMPPILRQLCDREKGLILVTGPTGSGKSTTLAGMIDYLNNTYEGHILTIEDPVEFVHKSKKCLVNQRELGVHTLVLCKCAPRGASRGPRYYPRRRNARSGYDSTGPDRGRNWPLGLRDLAYIQRAENRRPYHRRLPSESAGPSPRPTGGNAGSSVDPNAPQEEKRRPHRSGRNHGRDYSRQESHPRG